MENTLGKLNTGLIQNAVFLPDWKIYEPAEKRLHGRCFTFLFDNRRARAKALGGLLRENRGSVNRLRLRMSFFGPDQLSTTTMQLEIKTPNKALFRKGRFSCVQFCLCSVVFMIHPILSKKDAFGTCIKCPSKSDVRFTASQMKRVNKGRD